MTRIRQIRSQIENLKYDRDLLIQESKTIRGIFKRGEITKRINDIDSQIAQLNKTMGLWNQNPLQFDDEFTDLYQKIKTTFSKSELQDICFKLGVDFDEISGENKSDKIRELILYLGRRQRINELIQYCKKTRPLIDW